MPADAKAAPDSFEYKELFKATSYMDALVPLLGGDLYPALLAATRKYLALEEENFNEQLYDDAGSELPMRNTQGINDDID